MRKEYRQELKDLDYQIIEMASYIESSFEILIKFFKNEPADLDKILATEILINEKERMIENQALRLIIKEQPMATDFRRVASFIRIVGDLERIGDQIEDITVLIRTSRELLDLDMFEIVEMAQYAIRNFSDSIDSLVKYDRDLAQATIKGDNRIDKYYYDIRENIIEALANGSIQNDVALDIFLIVKYLEKIGDHSNNIAERVLYIIDGNQN